MKQVLVIGATGYAGSHAARWLAAKGYAVEGTYRHTADRGKVERLGARAVQADLDHLETVLPLVSRSDVTIYAAQQMMEPEHQAIAAMLQVQEGTGKTFLFTSGTGVLGQKTDGEWSEDTFTEDDPFIPSKWLLRRTETEIMVRAAAARGVRAIVVRPPILWGAGVSGVLKALYGSAAKTGEVCYVGRGLNLYSNVHVEDLAELYRLALEKGAAGALYHCVAGEVNFRALAEAVARELRCGTRSVTFETAEQIWGRFFTLIIMSTSSRSRAPRSRRELGWKPVHVDMLEEVRDPVYRVPVAVDD
jgi:nucleoside-diphosphate-sugar epimerase